MQVGGVGGVGGVIDPEPGQAELGREIVCGRHPIKGRGIFVSSFLAEPQLLAAVSPTLLPTRGSAYWQFYDAVAAAQLAAWWPTAPARVLDLSGVSSPHAAQLAAAGHQVVQVRAQLPRPEEPAVPGVQRLVADCLDFGWIQDASIDAILVESQALSLCLATEITAEQLARALRPGGRLLLVVDSLLLGLARLADQGRWAELADVPAADCVLVADNEGTITRCFGPQELRALLIEAGLTVDWVRPRSVVSVSAAERAFTSDGPGALAALVRTELTLAQEHEGESTGLHLVASARRPASAAEG